MEFPAKQKKVSYSKTFDESQLRRRARAFDVPTADFLWHKIIVTAKRGVDAFIYPGRVVEKVTRALHLRGMRIWAAALRDAEPLLDEDKQEYFDLFRGKSHRLPEL